MKFRPCIDIHNGRVKQIVGSSLADAGDAARENFTATGQAADYAARYRRDGLTGGHVIMLNPPSSPYYAATRAQALGALAAYPGGLQLGGGVTADNAAEYLDRGAARVIVTSYVFQNGTVNWDNLKRLVRAVGPEHIVIDLSARRRADQYFVVTDRWQKFTAEVVAAPLFAELAPYCSEFLVHGVDVEGKRSGMDLELVRLLGTVRIRPITYAGGLASVQDIQKFGRAGQGRLDYTIGSALDIFGGRLPYRDVVNMNP